MSKIAILTSSFGTEDSAPLERLRKDGAQIIMSPHKRKVTPEEILQIAGDCDGIIAGLEDLNASVLQKLSKLRVISRVGVGLDNVDMEAAKKLDIQVYNTPDAVTPAVAELTIGLIIDLLRHISSSHENLRKELWKKEMGNLLSGKKLGIVGFGRVGQLVAKFSSVFGAELAYFDVQPDKKSTVPYMSFEKLLSWADIITLHCSYSGNMVIDAGAIQKMKKGSWLINTARGQLVDEVALYEALLSQKLMGVALDVYANEPYTGPLKRDGLNVVITQHIGSYAKECRVRMEAEAVDNLLAGLKKNISKKAVC